MKLDRVARGALPIVIAALVATLPSVAPSLAQGSSPPAATALERLSASASVRLSRRTGLARFVAAKRELGLAVQTTDRAPEARAVAFVVEHGAAFGLRGAEDLELVRASRIDPLGTVHVRLRQVHEGLPVTGAELIVHLRDGRVTAASARTLEAAELASVARTPAFPAEAAQDSARDLVSDRGLTPTAVLPARLELFNPGLLDGEPGPTRLAWFVSARAPGVLEYVWIDALDGNVLLHFNQLPDARDRRIHTAANGKTLPGSRVRSEGEPETGDADADAAYRFAGDTYDYFWSQHGRDSIDDAGQPLVLTVHYGVNYANAFWDPSLEQMAFGDGVSRADDVVAHETTHGLTQHTADLYYYKQSGALNESFSDIFGETVDLGNGAGTDTADVRWLAAEDWPGVGPIRSMADPNVFGDPGKLSDPQLECSDWDNGGVHSNSGILNHAYALMVDGGTYNDQTITGIGLDKGGRILYRVLTAYLGTGSDFQDADAAIRQACLDLEGTGGLTPGDCSNVGLALDAVELGGEWPCTETSVSVVKTGSGSGRIVSSPPGIDCGDECVAPFPEGTTLFLTATPDPQSVLVAWEGDCLPSMSANCVLWVDGPQTAVARLEFTGTTYPMSVSLVGSGTVVSSPAGIDCGDQCQAAFREHAVVTLTAEPLDGFLFLGWGGACSGTGDCVVTMEGPTGVSATFSTGYPLSVSVDGPGSVEASPPVFACSDQCSATFPPGTSFTLTGRGANGFMLEAWGGDCSGKEPCRVTMDGPRTVAARFVEAPFAWVPGASASFKPTEAAWGDFDDDGDLDLVSAGYSAALGPMTVLYTNNAGVFTRSLSTFEWISGHVAWGDYDNDGDLDLLITGQSESGPMTRLYRNDGGTFSVAPTPPSLLGTVAEWGDVDNDGDLDLVVAVDGRDIQIYRNDKGSFAEAGPPLGRLDRAALAWGDVDGDGDLDLAAAGWVSVAGVTKVFRNESGNLVDTQSPLIGAMDGAVAWADYDADGDLDLLTTGRAELAGPAETRIYRNDQGGLVDTETVLTGTLRGGLAWGDYDGDGDGDLFLTATYPARETITLYRNANGAFLDVGSGVRDAPSSGVALGDYDNDGRLDLLWFGFRRSGAQDLYRGTQSAPDTAPTAPQNLRAAMTNGALALSWDPASDAESPATLLTYNIRVGSTPGGSQIVSSMADPATGFRKLPAPGNAGARTSHALRGLPAGRYYAAVQAIDPSFTGSPFGDEIEIVFGPVIVSQAAAAVETSTARLEGIVDPSGFDTTVHFEYGESVAYGSVTPSEAVGAGPSQVPVAGDISLLSDCQEYHFRVVVETGNLIVAGDDTVFRTSGCAVLELDAASYAAGEAAKTVKVEVRRGGVLTKKVRVAYAASAGTASRRADFTPVSGVLTFRPGQTSRVFKIPLVNDTLDEGDETVEIVLSNPQGGAILGEPSSAALTIEDDDSAGVIQFASEAESVSEARASKAIVVSRTGGSASGATVEYASVGGTATAGEDFRPLSGTLTFRAGQTSKRLVVRILADTLHEGDETVLLVLRNVGGGATLGARTSAALTIEDDDEAGVVQFSSDAESVSEARASKRIIVSRTGGSAGGVSVDYAIVGGTATAGEDYQAVSGTLTFGAGQASTRVVVPIVDDALDEEPETVVLALTNVTGGATIGPRPTVTLTIADDDR